MTSGKFGIGRNGFSVCGMCVVRCAGRQLMANSTLFGWNAWLIKFIKVAFQPSRILWTWPQMRAVLYCFIVNRPKSGAPRLCDWSLVNSQNYLQNIHSNWQLSHHLAFFSLFILNIHRVELLPIKATGKCKMLNAHSTSNSVWLYDFFDFHWGQKLIEQITGREWEKAARTQVLQSILRQVYCLYLFWSARTESLDVVHAWKKKTKNYSILIAVRAFGIFCVPSLSEPFEFNMNFSIPISDTVSVEQSAEFQDAKLRIRQYWYSA